MINLQFSKDELKTLLGFLSTAGYVLHAYADEELVDEESIEKESDLIQKILKAAQAAGLKDLVEMDDCGEHLAVSMEDEELSDIPERIGSFEETVFWGKLISSLAGRDMVDAIGEDAVDKMTEEEHSEKHQEFCQKYETEFSNFGLSRLKIAE